MTEVAGSIKDPRVAVVRGLRSAAARRSAGRCLVEGRTLVGQVLQAGSAIVSVLRAASAEGPDDRALAAALTKAGVPVHRVADQVLRQAVGVTRPVAWLGVAALPPPAGPGDPWGELVVVCAGIADPGNLGTIIRTARGFGVVDVVLAGGVADVTSRRVLDASRGGVLAARLRCYSSPVEAVAALHTAGFQVVVTSPGGHGVQALAPVRGHRVALVVGNETTGVDAATAAVADLIVQIPMAAAVESLNVGVATGISLYELRTKMVLAMLTDRIRSTLGRELALTARSVREALDTAMREAEGLSSTQAIALMVLAAERRTPRTELAADLGVAVAELDAVLAPLHARGWLTGDDTALAVTSGGEQALAALWAVQERVEDQICAGLSDAERAALTTLLQQVQQGAWRAASRP